MNVWAGSIALNRDHQLEGIRLVDPTSQWPCDIPKDAKLGLRSFVNPALIPLHARAGPSFELHTSSASTCQWLQKKLTGTIWLNKDDLDTQPWLQCPAGLLVNVDGSSLKKTGVVTSDLLIYGVLSSASPCARPPTPPHSSPFESNEPINAPTPRPYALRIYAAPLSTALLTQAQAFPSPPQSSTEEPVSPRAEFLPDISSPSPKRKRVATMFEVAAQHHRRVRQRGGEAVSQLMASSRPSSSSQNLQVLRIKREPDDDSPCLPSLDRISGHRSRSASIGNLQRPGSRIGRGTPGPSVDPQKRTSTPNPFLDMNSHRGVQQSQLHQVCGGPTEEKTSSTPNSPPKTTESIIAENKNLITRTILTCMRLYGISRSTNRSSISKAIAETPDPEAAIASPAPEALRAETPASGTSADDDHFKLVYHATYKAAAFALRKYLTTQGQGSASQPPLLEKKAAMTCIDDLLRIFCDDH